jgi:hypothetical protein
MITPTLMRARSLDKPGGGKLRFAVCEGAVGQSAVL